MALGIASGLSFSSVSPVDKYAVIRWQASQADSAGIQFENLFKDTYLTKEANDVTSITATWCFKGTWSNQADGNIDLKKNFHSQNFDHSPDFVANQIYKNTSLSLTVNDAYPDSGGDDYTIFASATDADLPDTGDEIYFRKLEIKVVDDEGNVKLLYYPPLNTQDPSITTTITNSVTYTWGYFNAVVCGDSGVISGLKLRMWSTTGNGYLQFGQLLEL